MSAVILGGGIAGLSAAHFLIRRGLFEASQLKIIEATNRVGGLIKTLKQPSGIYYEVGPRTIRPVGASGNETLRLVEDLKINKDVIIIPSNHAVAKTRFFLSDGKLIKTPGKIKDFLKTTMPFKKPLAFHLAQDLFTAKKVTDDDTMHNFFSRRFGQDVADYFIDPICRGICAGDAREISIKMLMKNLFELEQEYGSVFIGMIRKKGKQQNEKEDSLTGMVYAAKMERWSVWTLEGGLQLLPETLKDVLVKAGVEIMLNSECEKVQLTTNGAKLKCGDKLIDATHLISAIPAHRIAPLLQDDHPQLSFQLARIPYTSVVVANIQYGNDDIIKEPAFGFLVPSSQPCPLLGVVFDTCVVPQEEKTILTAMMGGHTFQKYLGDNPTESHILSLISEEFKKILAIDIQPEHQVVSILNKCLPQYIVGHEANVKSMRTYINEKKLPLSLVGCSYDGISVNDSIYSAKTQVDNIEKYE